MKNSILFFTIILIIFSCSNEKIALNDKVRKQTTIVNNKQITEISNQVTTSSLSKRTLQTLEKYKVNDQATPAKQFQLSGIRKPGLCNINLKIWKVDQMKPNGEPIPISKREIGPVRINGMVQDLHSKNSGVGLYAEVNGYRFKGTTGKATSSIPNYPSAGFSFEIPRTVFFKDQQSISFYLLRDNNRAYCKVEDKLNFITK